MPHAQFFLKENDTGKPIEGILRDGFGAPVDITGATVVFHMRLAPAGAVKVTGGSMGAVGSATNGRVKYSFSASDVDTPGTYEGEVQATFSNGLIRTFPERGYISVEIEDDIA